MLCLELSFSLSLSCFVLSLTSLSLSHHNLCLLLLACHCVLFSCHLLPSSRGAYPPPSDVFGWTLSKPFDNNTNCQTQGRTSFGPRRMLSIPCPLKVYSLVQEIRCVSHHGLAIAIYIKKYLQAKEEELWKLEYFTMPKYNLQKILV